MRNQVFEILSAEMQKTKDKRELVSLSSQRKSLNYVPKNEGVYAREEIPSRSEILLRELQELERELILKDEERSSDVCEKCQLYLLELLKPLNIHFNNDYEPMTSPFVPITYSLFMHLKNFNPPQQLLSSPTLNVRSSGTPSFEYKHGGTVIEEIQSIRTGRIYKGYSSIIHDAVIVKVNNDYNELDREVTTLRSFGRNPEYVVTLLEHVRESQRIDYAVFRYFGEPLTSYLISDVSSLNSFQLLMIQEMLNAVNWIHSKSYVHCDIKPENILIHDKGRGVVEVKLCDFDSAVPINQPWKIYTNDASRCGQLKYSRGWVSPEVYLFNKNLIHSRSATTLLAKVEMDIFSLGLVLACLLDQNRHPKMTILPTNESNLHDFYKSQSYLNSICCGRDPSFRDTIHRLCAYDPRQRGNLQQMLKFLDSRSRTKLQYQLQEERRWWQLNSQELIAKIDHLTQQSSSSSTLSIIDIESCLSDVANLLATHMQSQSEDIRIRFDELKRIISVGGQKDEILQKLREVKVQLNDMRE